MTTILTLLLARASADGGCTTPGVIDDRLDGAEDVPTDLVLGWRGGSVDDRVELTAPDGALVAGDGQPFVPAEALAPFTTYTFSLLVGDVPERTARFTTGAGPTEVTEAPELVSFEFVGRVEAVEDDRGTYACFPGSAAGWAFEAEVEVGDADVLSSASLGVARSTRRTLPRGVGAVYDLTEDDQVSPGDRVHVEGTAVQDAELCVVAQLVDAAGRFHESAPRCETPGSAGCATVPAPAGAILLTGALAATRRRRTLPGR